MFSSLKTWWDAGKGCYPMSLCLLAKAVWILFQLHGMTPLNLCFCKVQSPLAMDSSGWKTDNFKPLNAEFAIFVFSLYCRLKNHPSINNQVFKILYTSQWIAWKYTFYHPEYTWFIYPKAWDMSRSRRFGVCSHITKSTLSFQTALYVALELCSIRYKSLYVDSQRILNMTHVF